MTLWNFYDILSNKKGNKKEKETLFALSRLGYLVEEETCSSETASLLLVKLLLSGVGYGLQSVLRRF